LLSLYDIPSVNRKFRNDYFTKYIVNIIHIVSIGKKTLNVTSEKLNSKIKIKFNFKNLKIKSIHLKN